MRLTFVALAIMAAVVSSGRTAQAVPFGPATASIVYSFSPTVTLTPSSGTGEFDGGTVIFSTTGTLNGQVNGTGTATGTLSFSTAIGATTANAISDYLTFADTTGGTFNFDAATVTTQGFNNRPGVSTSIALYVLGTLGNTHLDLTPTATSLTITLNSTGGSAYSASATLSNPPAAIPVLATEPVSFVVLGSGLIGLGLLRRRR